VPCAPILGIERLACVYTDRDVVDVLGYLGDSFAAGAKKVPVELCVPKDPDVPTGLVNKEYLEIDNFEPS